MGFPVGYSEMPKLVLHLLFLLGHLRRVASWLLRLTGADVDSVADVWPDADHHQYCCHDPCGSERGLEEHSPAVRFDALSDGGAGDPLPEGCAVCLGDFHGAARGAPPAGVPPRLPPLLPRPLGRARTAHVPDLPDAALPTSAGGCVAPAPAPAAPGVVAAGLFRATSGCCLHITPTKTKP